MCMDGIERLDSQISPDKVWFMLMSSSYKTSLQIMKMRSRGNPAFTREISSRRSRACCSLPAQLSEKATCPSVVVYSLNHALFFCNPVDCGQPGSSVHGLTQLRILEWVHFLLQGIFLTQGSNPHILHWQVDFFFYHWATLGSSLAPIKIHYQSLHRSLSKWCKDRSLESEKEKETELWAHCCPLRGTWDSCSLSLILMPVSRSCRNMPILGGFVQNFTSLSTF